MGLKSELEADVATIYRSQWTRRNGRKVPEDSDVKAGNDAVDVSVAVLYSDRPLNAQIHESAALTLKDDVNISGTRRGRPLLDMREETTSTEEDSACQSQNTILNAQSSSASR